jgi:hypothetical protein
MMHLAAAGRRATARIASLDLRNGAPITAFQEFGRTLDGRRAALGTTRSEKSLRIIRYRILDIMITVSLPIRAPSSHYFGTQAEIDLVIERASPQLNIHLSNHQGSAKEVLQCSRYGRHQTKE